MSLHRRLYLVVGALAFVPLLVGAFFAAVLLPAAAREARAEQVGAAARSVATALTEMCRQTGITARGVALEAALRDPGLAVRQAVEARYASYAAVLDPAGRVLAEAGALPAGAPPAAALPGCSAGATGATGGILAERVAVSDPARPELAGAVGVTVLDAAALRELAGRLGTSADLVLVEGTAVVAGTADPAEARALAESAGRREPGGLLVRSQPVEGGPGWTVLAAAPAPGAALQRLAAAVVLAAAGVVAVFAWRLARGLTLPLTELDAAARRVADGDLDTTVLVGSSTDEVGRVAASFNRMTGELKRNLEALQRSRDEMRESLERVGETLQHTHDLDRLLEVVVEAAMAMVGARAGVAYAAESSGVLTRGAAAGLDRFGWVAERHLPLAQGVLGGAAAAGEPVRGRVGGGPGELKPVAGEPDSGEVLAVPLRRGSRVVGVLGLYDREGPDGAVAPFGPEEEEALRTLAGQAGIAVDNVLLHREAERLSITDPMTGLWNFRYLSMSLNREIERASRFARPLAVLMLDLDHFKAVNDTFGHACGDAVLRELAARVGEQVRDIDTLARYGGEEFVLVLPETGAQGAGTVAERVCAAVRRAPFLARGDGDGDTGTGALPVTVSIGVATYPQHGESPATLMRAADEALYRAKAAGRDRWELADG